MKRCSRCILPETIPGIIFDQDGVCNFCSDYRKFDGFDEEDLHKLVHSNIQSNDKYDCIVPLSGGRDSTFVLYYAKAVLGLKVLAVNFDNEFQTEQAIKNITNACKILDIDLFRFSSRINIAHKIVHNSIHLSLPFGLLGISKHLCSACTYGYRSIAYQSAIKYNVPFIFWGESQNEATQSIELALAQKFNIQLKRNLLNLYTYRTRFFKILQRIELRVPGNNIFSISPVKLKNPYIKEIRLFDYIPWDRMKIKDTIVKELSWEKPKDNISSWRIDCRLHPFINYCHVKLFSCTKDCLGYCNMINDNQMNRSEALLQENELLNVDMEYLYDLLHKDIGLSKTTANKVLQL